MLYKFFMTCAITILLTGCASDLKREVSQLEYSIQRSDNLINEAKTSLANNPDVYNGESCLYPEKGREPKFSCHTVKQAKENALASCAIAYKGCDVVVQLYSDRLDSASEQFLASQACEAMLAEMKGERLDAGKVIVDGSIAIAKDRCKNGGFFGKLFGCSYAVAGEIAKFAEFSSCVSNQSTLCLKNYQDWENGPTRRKQECESNLETISSETNNISSSRWSLKRKKDSLMWKLFGS